MKTNNIKTITNKLNTTIIFLLSYHSNKKTLDNYLQFANNIIQNELSDLHKLNGILHLQKHLTLLAQNKAIQQTIQKINTTSQSRDFMFLEEVTWLSYCKENNIKNETQYSMSSFPILSSPWRTDRLLNTFLRIGSIIENPFLQQKDNHHYNVFIYPLNIIDIQNGLHSGTVGLLEKNSTISITHILDISGLYQNFYFDGNYLTHKISRKKIKLPIYEYGILFEIGRLILKNNLSILSPLTSRDTL